METRPYRALQWKLAAATVAFSLIPLLALGGVLHYRFDQAYRSKLADGLKSLIENRRHSIQLFLDERVAQMVTVARTQTLERLTDEAYLGEVFDIMQYRSRSFIDLGVIDDQGRHLAYVGPHHDQLKGVNYAHEEWFQAVKSSGVYLSEVFLGFRKIPHFVIAVARLEGTRSWILRATINSETIDRIVSGAQLGKRGDAFIVNAANILQTPPRHGGNLLGPSTAPDYSSTVDTIVELVEHRGQSTLFAAARIENPRWVLILSEDPAEEMAAMFGARRISLLVLAAGILLVLAGAFHTSRAIANELLGSQREKAKSDEMLMQSSKMAALGKMAAGVAHEINNPLQIIGDQAGWMTDLLETEDLAGSANAAELKDCVAKIERHVERCRTVTHRLLRFGRRMEPVQEAVNVNHVMAEALTFLENEAHFRDIKLQVSYDEALPSISTDPAQLQQVFLNIVDNALDAIGKAGTIRIRTGPSSMGGREVEIEISDDGPGMSRAVLAKVFDPFFTTKKPGEGTGLGLSISHSIIEKLGGRITVQSQEGRGTTFTIVLPAP